MDAILSTFMSAGAFSVLLLLFIVTGRFTLRLRLAILSAIMPEDFPR